MWTRLRALGERRVPLVGAAAAIALVAALLAVVADDGGSDETLQVIDDRSTSTTRLRSTATTTTTAAETMPAGEGATTVAPSTTAAPTTTAPAPDLRGIWSVAWDGTGNRRLVADVAPNGGGPQSGGELTQEICYAGADLRLHVMAPDGSGDRVVSRHEVEPAAFHGAACHWFLAGEERELRVAFATAHGANGAVRSVRPDGSGEMVYSDQSSRRIVAASLAKGGIDWSDGAHLYGRAYEHDSDGQIPGSVYDYGPTPVDPSSLWAMGSEWVYTHSGATWHRRADNEPGRLIGFAADSFAPLHFPYQYLYSGDGNVHVRAHGQHRVAGTGDSASGYQDLYTDDDLTPTAVAWIDRSGGAPALTISRDGGPAKRVATIDPASGRLVFRHGWGPGRTLLYSVAG